jgi:hypothetical protein
MYDKQPGVRIGIRLVNRPDVLMPGMQENAAIRVDTAFGWQGRQGSNLRQPVLETGTLPTELHPYREPEQRHRFAPFQA